MDGDDFTLMTTESMAIVLNDNGCCVRHPSVKLKDYDKNGDVYLKESCPECQSEFMKSQSLLLEKRRELDRKLQELGDDSPHDERHADFVQMVAPSVGGVQPEPYTRSLSPTLPMVRPVAHDLDALAAQMQHIQHMQDIVTLQKDRELYDLREKLEALQSELTEKKIEIALLNERMSQQQLSYERELKLIQRAVALDKERREVKEPSQGNAKEIHIRSLNVQVGQDYAVESSVTQKVAAATLTDTLERQGNKVFIAGKTSAGEESIEGPKSRNSPVESNMTSPVASTMISPVKTSAPTGMDELLEQAGSPSMVLAETSNNSSDMAAVATAYAVEDNSQASDYDERPPTVSRFESVGELPAVLGQLKNDDSVVEDLIDEKYVVVEKEEVPVWKENELSYRSYDSTTVGESTYLSSTADESPHNEYPFHRPLREGNAEEAYVGFVPKVQERAVEEETSPFIDDYSYGREGGDYHKSDDEGEDDMSDEEEEDDTFDASGHGPAPPITPAHHVAHKLTPTHIYKPGPLTAPHGLPTDANEHRKEPMRASVESPSPPQHGGITGVLGFRGTGSGATPVEDFEFNENAPPTVPLDEQVTLSSLDPSDRFNPRVVEEDYTVAETTGPTVASSTYGENRHVVSNQILLDPYGDRGSYSGVLLLSTNLPHGNGKMLYEDDGRTYDGDWRHGRWHGWGQATFSNGDRFEGFYKFDQRHGQGKYEWSDGRIYEGEFTDDKRCGKGHFIWPDGADYVGDFTNGQRDGYGVYKFSANRGLYKGDWVNGRYEGYGECKWSDGRMYKGEWKAGMAHGVGTEWYPDGSVRHEGNWFEDEPVRDEYQA